MWFTVLLAALEKVPASALQLFTGINFGAIFSGISKFFAALIQNIQHYWFLWLIGTLLVTNGFTAWEWRSTDANLVRERAAHAADIASFKNAQAIASAKADAERAAIQKESKANADQADANYSGLLAQYHASLLRYAQANSGAGQPGNHQLPAPKGTDGPSTGTQLPATITISGYDAEICAENTARLEAAHDWAMTLLKETPQ